MPRVVCAHVLSRRHKNKRSSSGFRVHLMLYQPAAVLQPTQCNHTWVPPSHTIRCVVHVVSQQLAVKTDERRAGKAIPLKWFFVDIQCVTLERQDKDALTLQHLCGLENRVVFSSIVADLCNEILILLR